MEAPVGLANYDEVESIAEWIWEAVTDNNFEAADENQDDTDTQKDNIKSDWLNHTSFDGPIGQIRLPNPGVEYCPTLILDPLLEIVSPPPDRLG